MDPSILEVQESFADHIADLLPESDVTQIHEYTLGQKRKAQRDLDLVLDELGADKLCSGEEEDWETTEKEHTRKRTKSSDGILDEFPVGDENYNMLESSVIGGVVGEDSNCTRSDSANPLAIKVDERRLEEVTSSRIYTPNNNARLNKIWARFKAVDEERKKLLARLLEEETQNPSAPLFLSPEYVSLLKGMGPSAAQLRQEQRTQSRLNRRSSGRKVVNTFVSGVTECTEEAKKKIEALQHKQKGIAKKRLYKLFAAHVNPFLAEPIAVHVFWKYLFQRTRQSSGLYSDSTVHKTTRKGGGTKKLTGVAWRNFDLKENCDALAEVAETLSKEYNIDVNQEQIIASVKALAKTSSGKKKKHQQQQQQQQQNRSDAATTSTPISVSSTTSSFISAPNNSTTTPSSSAIIDLESVDNNTTYLNVPSTSPNTSHSTSPTTSSPTTPISVPVVLSHSSLVMSDMAIPPCSITHPSHLTALTSHSQHPPQFTTNGSNTAHIMAHNSEQTLSQASFSGFVEMSSAPAGSDERRMEQCLKTMLENPSVRDALRLMLMRGNE